MDVQISYDKGAKAQVAWPFWGKWVLGSTLGATVGWLLSGFISLLTFGLGFPAAGAIAGSVLGGVQAWVLESSFRRFRLSSMGVRWLIATLAGGGLGFIIFVAIIFLPPIFRLELYGSLEGLRATESIAVLAGGAVLGTAQWLILKQYSHLAGWWIVITAVSWVFGWYLADSLIAPVLSSTPDPDGTLATGFVFLMYVEVVVATVMGAVLTGVTLLLLFRRLYYVGDSVD